MNRVEKLFAKEKAYVGYLTIGHKGLEHSLQMAEALIAGGVTMLELGVPFSDPVADGPVIQRAAQQAVEKQIDLLQVLQVAKTLRQRYPGLPLVLFSYYNPILQQFDKGILEQAQQAGIDAILVVDLSLEESSEFVAGCKQVAIAPIFVVTPDTNKQRLQKIKQLASGFIYYACRKGTTGMQSSLPADFVTKVQQVKEEIALPVVAGFGIANREMAAEVLQYADGFVVGSKFVDAIEQGSTAEQLTELAKGLLTSA